MLSHILRELPVLSLRTRSRPHTVLSSRVQRGICFCLLAGTILFIGVPFITFLEKTHAAEKEPRRPHIFGIARVRILSTDVPAARAFYRKLLGKADECHWCEDVPGLSFPVSYSQGIVLSPAPSPSPTNLIEEITFATDDVGELRRYFKAHKVAVSNPHKPEDNYLNVADPEGHRIGFLTSRAIVPPTSEQALDTMFPLRIIHAGFVVRDRDAEDRFYKDLLGFHVYWHGGMKDGEDNWVDMQVPDGTDWIEYMLKVSPNADKRELGVMNHFAIGVDKISSRIEQLRQDGVVPILDEPKIGRDGKWQLNLYDPDDTRVEFMEFTPVQKPCCSEFTGPHPKP